MNPEAGQGGETTTRATPAVAEISKGIVQVHVHSYGRGPTKAKTVWREEIVVCVLGEIFTPSERLLVESGRFDQVRANRTSFQDAIEPQLRAIVEEATGWPVKAFFSQVTAEEGGMASEVFVLDRPDFEGGGPSGS